MGGELEVVGDQLGGDRPERPCSDARLDGDPERVDGLLLEPDDLGLAGSIEGLALAIGQHRPGPLGVDDPAEAGEPGCQLSLRISAGRRHGRRHLGPEGVEDVDDDGPQHLLLAAEVLIDQPHAHPGVVGHGLH